MYAKKEPNAEITKEMLKRGEDLSLCFWLGVFIPIYGLVIAAIIAKSDGVKSALWGMLTMWFVTFIAGIVVGLFFITNIE